MHTSRAIPVWLNFGAYGVDVAVDRDTGAITIHDVVFVADVGTVINPIAHRGQIDGGFMMGLGTRSPRSCTSKTAGSSTSRSPTTNCRVQRDMPPFRVINLEPDDGPGPYGARAAGEFNTAGVAPAIANADRRGVRRAPRQPRAHRRTHLRRTRKAFRLGRLATRLG